MLLTFACGLRAEYRHNVVVEARVSHAPLLNLRSQVLPAREEGIESNHISFGDVKRANIRELLLVVNDL